MGNVDAHKFITALAIGFILAKRSRRTDYQSHRLSNLEILRREVEIKGGFRVLARREAKQWGIDAARMRG